jgi:hypothetical protein
MMIDVTNHGIGSISHIGEKKSGKMRILITGGAGFIGSNFAE